MKKFWKALAAIGISAALCVPLAACGEDGATTDQERLYESYVLYAQAAGDEVLSYQEWLDSVRGAAGEDGKSAYEIAVENGFEGTEEEWLASLKGQDGEDGKDGAAGEKGDKGDKSDKGDKGDPGEKGEQGDKGDKGDKGDPGEKGDQGDKGDKGEQGVGIKDITYSYGYNAEEGYFYTEIIFNLTDGTKTPVKIPSAMNPKTTYVATTAAELKGLLEDGAAQVALGADIEVGTAGDASTGLTVTNGTITIDLNGYEISNVGTQFALVVNGENAKLNLIDSSEEQTGGIYGGKGGNNQTVRVTGGAQVDIYGGNYSVGPDASNAGNSCIEVAGLGGLVNIYGGVFSSEAAYNDFYYVLNTTQTQGTRGAIYVYGGMFVNFDPSKGDDSSTSNGGSTVNVQSTYVAEGYGVTASEQDGETVYTVLKISENLGETFLANNAAEVEALMNAGVKGISLGADIKMNLVIEEGQTLALDLNGHTLTSDVAGQATILNNGTLTVTDSVGTGLITRGTMNWYTIVNEGLMNLQGIGVSNTTDTSSSLIINNLSLKSERAAELTIDGGKYVSVGSNVVKNDEYGILTITGGEFINSTQDSAVIQASGSQTTISGGTFVNSGADSTDGIIRAAAVNGQTVSVTISGGEFGEVNGKASAILMEKNAGNGDTAGKKVEVVINDGTFYGNVGARVGSGTSKSVDTLLITGGRLYGSIAGIYVSASVEGGTFSKNVSSYVAEGYKAVAQGDVWVVMPEQA